MLMLLAVFLLGSLSLASEFDFQLNSVHEAGIANSATTSFTTQNQYDSSVSSQHKRYIEEVSAMLGTAQQPDDDVPWTVVDLKISSGRRFTPANHTIYLIEEITTSSTIYFDGRKKGLLPPVYNWAVVFGPEVELFPWLVYVYAEPGSNCTVICNVPNKGSTSASQKVELSMKKNNGYVDGIFDIETIGVDHLHLISSSNLNLTVTGSPSNADLFLQGGFGSEIHINELYSHALVSNFARVTIGPQVLSRKAAVIVIGASEISADVYSTSRYGYYFNGCLQLPEVVPNPYSTWMTAMLNRSSISAAAIGNCALSTMWSNQLSVGLRGISILGLSRASVTSVNLVGGEIINVIDPGRVWKTATLYPSSVVVDGTYTFGVSNSPTSQIVIPSTVLDRNTDLLVVTSDPVPTSGPSLGTCNISWLFVGRPTDELGFLWTTGRGCKGAIYTATKPRVFLSGADSITFTMDSSALVQAPGDTLLAVFSDTNATLTLPRDQFAVSFPASGMGAVTLVLRLTHGPTEVVLLPDANMPFIHAGSQKVAILSYEKDFSVTLFGDGLTYDWANQSFQTTNANLAQSNCLDPNVYGDPAYWVQKEWAQVNFCPGRLVTTLDRQCRAKRLNLTASTALHFTLLEKNESDDLHVNGLEPHVLVELNAGELDPPIHFNINVWNGIPVLLFIGAFLLIIAWVFGLFQVFVFPMTKAKFPHLPVQDFSLTLFYVIGLLVIPNLDINLQLKFFTTGVHYYILYFLPLCTIAQSRAILGLNIFFIIFLILGTILYYFLRWRGKGGVGGGILVVLPYFLRFLNVVGLYVFSPANFWLYSGGATAVMLSMVALFIYGASFMWSDYIGMNHKDDEEYVMVGDKGSKKMRGSGRGGEQHSHLPFWSSFAFLKMIFVCAFLKWNSVPDLSSGLIRLIIPVLCIFLTALPPFKWVESPFQSHKRTCMNLLPIVLLAIYFIFALVLVLVISLDKSYDAFLAVLILGLLVSYLIFLLPILAACCGPRDKFKEDVDDEFALKIRTRDDFEVEMEQQQRRNSQPAYRAPQTYEPDAYVTLDEVGVMDSPLKGNGGTGNLPPMALQRSALVQTPPHSPRGQASPYSDAPVGLDAYDGPSSADASHLNTGIAPSRGRMVSSTSNVNGARTGGILATPSLSPRGSRFSTPLRTATRDTGTHTPEVIALDEDGLLENAHSMSKLVSRPSVPRLNSAGLSNDGGDLASPGRAQRGAVSPGRTLRTSTKDSPNVSVMNVSGGGSRRHRKVTGQTGEGTQHMSPIAEKLAALSAARRSSSANQALAQQVAQANALNNANTNNSSSTSNYPASPNPFAQPYTSPYSTNANNSSPSRASRDAIITTPDRSPPPELQTFNFDASRKSGSFLGVDGLDVEQMDDTYILLEEHFPGTITKDPVPEAKPELKMNFDRNDSALSTNARVNMIDDIFSGDKSLDVDSMLDKIFDL